MWWPFVGRRGTQAAVKTRNRGKNQAVWRPRRSVGRGCFCLARSAFLLLLIRRRRLRIGSPEHERLEGAREVEASKRLLLGMRIGRTGRHRGLEPRLVDRDIKRRRDTRNRATRRFEQVIGSEEERVNAEHGKDLPESRVLADERADALGLALEITVRWWWQCLRSRLVGVVPHIRGPCAPPGRA